MSVIINDASGNSWQVGIDSLGRLTTTPAVAQSASGAGSSGNTNSLTIITNALLELNILAAGETASGANAAFCLGKLNRIFDNWNAESLFIYGTQLFEGVLTPNHNPHTFGTSGADFTVSTARQRILEANLILNDVSPKIYNPLKIVDADWWMNNPVPSQATQIPYYLYPNYAFPNGQLYLWPVPTTAYGIRLNLWTLFSQVALSDSFTLPPGYEDAVTLTLSEAIASAFGAQVPPMLVANAAEARARIKSLNSESPTMACDGAVQSMDQRPGSSMANFLSGFFN